MGEGLPLGAWPVAQRLCITPDTCRRTCQRPHAVGTIANMKAALITRVKSVAEGGGATELVVWRVPQPVPRSGHAYKYRAVCAVDGVRVIGFDNERGKGDHCHLDGRELPYKFTTVDALVEDFIAAVDAARRTP